MMNGSTPAFFNSPITATTILARFEIPRLPTPTAIRMPGFNCSRIAANPAATEASISTGGVVSNRWRTRNIWENSSVTDSTNQRNLLAKRELFLAPAA